MQDWAEDEVVSELRGEMTQLVELPVNNKRYLCVKWKYIRDSICDELDAV